jgi:hypothetical protein
MDKWTNGQRDKWTNGQRDKGTNGQMDKWTKGQMDRTTKRVKMFCHFLLTVKKYSKDLIVNQPSPRMAFKMQAG